MSSLLPSSLLPRSSVISCVDDWLREDFPPRAGFDIGGAVAAAGGGDRRQISAAEAFLFCKSLPIDVTLSGRVFFDAVFERVDGGGAYCTTEWMDGCEDGRIIPTNEANRIWTRTATNSSPWARWSGLPWPKRPIARVSGPIGAILRGERVALNCIGRMCGIATALTNMLRTAKGDGYGWNGRIACTRKTTPGFRLAEKYAVICGGGDAHRFDLGAGSMVMLKDNHIDACGGDVTRAVRKAKELASFSTKLEVESRTAEEAIAAARAGADVVMLDNFDAEYAKNTAALLKGEYPNVIVEASGGIDVKNFTNYLDENIDVLSMGCLTQGYPCMDFSLKVTPPAN